MSIAIICYSNKIKHVTLYYIVCFNLNSFAECFAVAGIAVGLVFGRRSKCWQKRRTDAGQRLQVGLVESEQWEGGQFELSTDQSRP